LTSVRENSDLSDAARANLVARLETALRDVVAEVAILSQRQEAERQRAEVELRLAEERREKQLAVVEEQVRRQEKVILEAEREALRSVVEARLQFLDAEDRLKQAQKAHDGVPADH